MKLTWWLWPFQVPAPIAALGRVGRRLLSWQAVLWPSTLRVRIAVLAILAVGSGLPPAVADPIAYFTGPLSSGGDGLLQIDLATGDVSEIGAITPEIGINSLAFGPDGTLYGIGNNLAGGAHLAVVDPATGASTVLVELMLADPSSLFEAMTADACGRLWAEGLLGVHGGGLRKSIIAIDPASGEVQEVLSGPFSGGPSGLAASGETLFTVHSGALSVLDPATGDITPIGGTSLPDADLDFAPDGFLWGAGGPIPLPVPDPWGRTFRVDPQTGQFEVVAENRQYIYGGGAIGPPPGVCGSGSPLAIPSASPLGLAVLAVLLAAAGFTISRRSLPRLPTPR